jgi:hypothetical protein
MTEQRSPFHNLDLLVYGLYPCPLRTLRRVTLPDSFALICDVH